MQEDGHRQRLACFGGVGVGVGVGIWVVEVRGFRFPREYIFGLRGNFYGRGVVPSVVEWYRRLWADLALYTIALNGVR